MRRQQDGAARRLVDAARLHADEAVLDQVDAADAVVAAELVQLGEQRGRRQRLAVEADGVAARKADRAVGRLIGRLHRRDGALIDERRRPRSAGSSSTLPSDEECSRLASTENGASPSLSLATGIWCSRANVDQVVAALEVPFAPGRDDLDRRLERVIASSKRTWSLPLPVAP